MKHQQTVLSSWEGRNERGLGLRLVPVSSCHRYSAVWFPIEIHSSSREDLLLVLPFLLDEEEILLASCQYRGV